MERGCEGWQLPENLVVKACDLRVGKTTPDAFLRTTLEDLLKAQHIEHLVICGYASEFCVDTSTRSALGRGYDVTLAANAHTTHDKTHASGEQIRAHHNATLPSLAITFGVRGTAVSTEDIGFQ